jgi:hypothetical protein
MPWTLGCRVVLATDALCSSSDNTHDALPTLYRNRFSQQIETATSDRILASWLRASKITPMPDLGSTMK